MKINSIYSIAGVTAGIVLIALGLILWANYGYPTTELIPYKNTFGTNPIHLAYFGVIVSLGSIIHGVIKHGWFNKKNT